MKTLKSVFPCLFFFLSIVDVSAQSKAQANDPVREYDHNQPRLFKELPDRLHLKMDDFSEIFDLEVGKSTTLHFAKNFSFHGTVVSKAEDAMANLKSIVIKSPMFSGAAFTLSRLINENNTLSYRGRIMSFKHGDAYDLVLEEGAYYLIKKNVYDLYDE
jgi:hypothetical protein